MTLHEASVKCRRGAIVAWINAFIFACIILIAMTTDFYDNTQSLQNYADPFNILDVIALVILGVGLWYKSRTAAVLLCAYLIFLCAMTFLEIQVSGNVSIRGIIGKLVVGYFYFQALVGTYSFVRLRREEDPIFRNKPVWLFISTGGVGSLIVLLMGFDLYLSFIGAPETFVQTGDEIPTSYKQELVDNEILLESENIEYFYSYGITSILEGGNILTDETITAYERVKKDDPIDIYWSNFADVKDIVPDQKGHLLLDTVVKIVHGTPDDQGWFYLNLSVERGGDQKFIKALEQKTGLKMRPRNAADDAAEKAYEDNMPDNNVSDNEMPDNEAPINETNDNSEG